MNSKTNINLNEVTDGMFDNLEENTVMELEITKIYPNKYQPRKLFDELKLQELADSILKHGLLEPIVVVKNGHKYMIIAGERRWRASLLAELPTIKASIISADEKAIRELALIENIQRDDLTQFEIAKYIRTLWDSGDYKLKKDLADTIGKRDTYISKALSVSSLHASIIEDIETNKLEISISVLDEIARVGNEELQILVYEKYKAGDIKRDDIKFYKNPPPVHEVDTDEADTLTKKMDFKEDIWEPAEERKALNEKGELNADVWFLDGLRVLGREDIASKLEKNKSYKYHIKETNYSSSEPTEDDESFTFWITGSYKKIKELKGKSYLEDLSKKMTHDYLYQMTIYKEKETFPRESQAIYKTGFGFGTQNKEMTYIGIVEGDFTGTFAFDDDCGEFVKSTNNLEYQIIIKESDSKETNIIKKYRDENDMLRFERDELNNKIENLEKQLKEAKAEEETLYINKKDMYIIGYCHKNGVPLDSGSRVRALNINKAIEKAKDIYPNYANDKNYIFNAKPLNTFSGTLLFTTLKTYDEFDYNEDVIPSIVSDIENSLKIEKENFKTFKITIEGKNNKTSIKDEPKEIKLIEVLSNSVYIEYVDFDSVDVSFNKAKEIIKNSPQDSIKYTASSNEKACDFINKIPNRSQRNNCLVLKSKK